MSQGSSQPRDPQPLIDRFTELCASDSRILAAFLGGSHAKGTADAFSDVDLGLIASEEVGDLAGLRRRIIHRLGDVLFLEDFGTEVTSFFILDDGTEAELSTGRESDFITIHAGPFRVLHDPKGVLEGVTFPWPNPDPEERRTTLHEVLFWFWHELSHFTVAIGRRQLWWAAGQLEALRGHCVNLVRIDQNVEAGRSRTRSSIWRSTWVVSHHSCRRSSRSNARPCSERRATSFGSSPRPRRRLLKLTARCIRPNLLNLWPSGLTT